MTTRARSQAALALINAVERTLTPEFQKTLTWSAAPFGTKGKWLDEDKKGWSWAARAAIVALGKMKCEAAVPVLSRALSMSADSNVPGLAANALENILGKPPERVPDWIQP